MKSEIGLAEWVENLHVGRSVPPRATKNHQNHLRAVFYLIKQKGYRYLCILNTVRALFVT